MERELLPIRNNSHAGFAKASRGSIFYLVRIEGYRECSHPLHILTMNFQRIASISAAVAIVLGAFGAHALEERLVADGMLDPWRTAVLYHLVHSVALLAIALYSKNASNGPFGWAAKLWSWGIILFSGSLYALALGGPGWLGPITPLGGLSFIAGWVVLAFSKKVA